MKVSIQALRAFEEKADQIMRQRKLKKRSDAYQIMHAEFPGLYTEYLDENECASLSVHTKAEYLRKVQKYMMSRAFDSRC